MLNKIYMAPVGQYNPQLLFATDVLDDLDVDCMAAARKQKIKIIGMVRSWDNLSSGGLVQLLPDTLLLWNPFLYMVATRRQHIPERILKIVGIPHYDWYAKPEIIMPRDVFLRRLGIDPKKKIVLFAGIGDFLNPHEPEVAEIISELVTSGKLGGDIEVIFRPHPNFMVNRERIKKLPHIIFDDGVASYTGNEKTSWEMDQEKISHLVNSLYHADVVITTASTITMDAVSFDKPVICIAFDGKSKEVYENSVKRFYHDYTHYIWISRTHGFRTVNSKDELEQAMVDYLSNPHLDEKGRKKIVDEFIWKLDGQSARRVAEHLRAGLKT